MPIPGVCDCNGPRFGAMHGPNCAAVFVMKPPRATVGGVPCSIDGCRRGVWHDHPELRVSATTPENCVDCHASARCGGGACPRHAESKYLGAVPPEMAAAKKLVAEKDAEIKQLREAATTVDGDFEAYADEASDLLRRARPILADYAHHPEVAELLTDVRRFLEPDPPAAPKAKSAADVVLAHAFGPPLAAGPYPHAGIDGQPVFGASTRYRLRYIRRGFGGHGALTEGW